MRYLFSLPKRRYKFRPFTCHVERKKCDFSFTFREQVRAHAKRRERAKEQKESPTKTHGERTTESERERERIKRKINWRNYINNTKGKLETYRNIYVECVSFVVAVVSVVAKPFVGRLLLPFVFPSVLSMSLARKGIKNESENKNTTLRFNHCQASRRKQMIASEFFSSSLFVLAKEIATEFFFVPYVRVMEPAYASTFRNERDSRRI